MRHWPPDPTLALLKVGVSFFLCALAVDAQTAGRQADCRCGDEGCRKTSQAELFIRSFGTSGTPRGLRTSELEMEAQVKNAFWQIDSTRLQVESGRKTPHEGDIIIDGFEQIIRDFVHDQANEALVRAATGQASDLPAISKSLGGILSVARQDAFLGREEVALQAQQQARRTLIVFSEEFARSCEQQEYPVQVALELERQNQLMATGVSLEHCIDRAATVELQSQGVTYRFESCLKLTGLEPWKLTISGRVTGEGSGGVSLWEAKTLFRGLKDEPYGEMEVFSEEIEQEPESVRVPDDAGPNARPNGCAAAPAPEPPAGPKKARITKLRIRTILLTGERGFDGNDAGPWAEAEVKLENRPCRP